MPSASALPVPSESRPATPETAPGLAAAVRALVRNEHEGGRYLRHLARQEPALYRGLFPLLLEVMARDAEKHATILRYVLRLVEGGDGTWKRS